MSRDEIRISGIEAFGFHGVLDSERANGQTFRVDVVLHVDLTAAGQSDDLAHTVDYSSVAQHIHDVIVGQPVDLIETLAQRIADVCLSYPLVDDVEVKVNKPQAPIEVPFDNVAVIIRRGR
jgi:dihydroneopterin aldolase/2-amino-4-hydroxy-6-hydroxymethyldihydropteridine diphosphokinase